MDINLIKIIEEKRNKLWCIIKRKGIFASKKEKDLLKKYDKLLLEMYKKISI